MKLHRIVCAEVKGILGNGTLSVRSSSQEVFTGQPLHFIAENTVAPVSVWHSGCLHTKMQFQASRHHC